MYAPDPTHRTLSGLRASAETAEGTAIVAAKCPDGSIDMIVVFTM